ncbi:unnamed protein product [Amaranthus hypochondriacus]
MASILRLCFSLIAYLMIIQFCVGSSNSPKKVSLDLYYESLCPGSSKFIANDLHTIYKNGLIEVVDLRFFPWGNAIINSDGSFTCQHGPTECLLNTVEACAIDIYPMDDRVMFIQCIENLVYEGNSTNWKTCFKLYDLDPELITDCYETLYGKRLEVMYAKLTNALIPPHQYVPWVVVDGKPLQTDYENFVSYICEAYKGPQPSACNKASLASVPRKMTKDGVVVSRRLQD